MLQIQESVKVNKLFQGYRLPRNSTNCIQSTDLSPKALKPIDEERTFEQIGL